MPGRTRRDYRIYADLADWWPLISPPSEYAEEAACLARILRCCATPPVRVLDLGSGGGHVAAHLPEDFSPTLVDISGRMLAVSSRLNPGRTHIAGDMRTVRLGRMFDAILVHDAIDYIIGGDDLRQVIETAAVHCRPGGLALFVPDYIADTFAELTGAGGGGVDGAGRTASFTERTWDPDPGDDWVQADYEFTLCEADGSIQVVRESHRLSAFSRALWRDLLAEAGFDLEPGDQLAGEPARMAGGEPAAGSAMPPNLFIGRRRPAR